MKILIINGNTREEDTFFDSYLEELKNLSEQRNINVHIIHLRNIDLHDCIGCYSCWLKKPGLCIYEKDGMDLCLKEYLKAHVVIFASPIIMGFISAKLKCFNDRLFPLSHPFLRLRKDRMSHLPRYEHYPEIVLLLREIETSEESPSLELIANVYKNKEKGLKKMFTTKTNPSELFNEIAYY